MPTIRIYPQTGAYGAMGMNRMGAVSAQTFYSQKLQSVQQVSNLRLGYERALWNERLEKVRLEERLKNPYAMYGAGMLGASPMMAPYAAPYMGAGMMGGMGGMGGGFNPFGFLGRWF